MNIFGLVMVVAVFGGAVAWIRRINARHLAAMTDEERRKSEHALHHEIGIW